MTTFMTGRTTIPEAEALLGGYFPVLDHGFIALRDYMGGDLSIEEAARMSYGAGTRPLSDTRNLLRFLMRHEHTTPFEMVELKFHVAMPIFVARQWVRQRTASLNEYSGRYSLMPMAFYTPEKYPLQSKTNKQGSAAEVLESEHVRYLSQATRLHAQDQYEWLCEQDVARELARIDLPLSTYTQWVWKIDLHNLLKFLAKRCDSHAQWEIRVYANIMAGVVKRLVPLAFEGWVDYHFAGARMSRMELEVLRRLVIAEVEGVRTPDYGVESLSNRELELLGLSKREVTEFKAKLQPQEVPSFDLDLGSMKPGSYFEERMAALVPKVDRG